MRAAFVWAFASAAMGLPLASGCGGGSSSGGAAQGGVGQSCYPNGTCNAGLSCFSNLCVDANADGGSDGSGVNDSSVGMDTGSGGDSSAGDTGTTPHDSGGGTGDTGTDSGAGGCTTYMASTVAAMRMGHASGCFRLASVVAIGVTPGPDYRLFAQDAAGGNYSAMRTTCSASDVAHPCTIGATVGALPAGHAVTLQGRYVYAASTSAEDFYLDTATDDGAGASPVAATVTLADISRGSTQLALAYQRVTVTASGASQLVMYDWSPSEFAVTGAAACPYQLGFGVVPQSAGVLPGAGCTGTTSQPAGQTSPSSQEVLIGTDFSSTFTVSSDCRCSSNVPTAISTTMAAAGILVWNVPATGAGYMYLAPQTNADVNSL